MDAKKRKDTTCSRLFVGVHELFSTIATFKGRQVSFCYWINVICRLNNYM